MSDNFEKSFFRLWVYADIFNRARCSAHAMLHVRALKGRASGARARKQLRAVTQNKFTIRADVNDEQKIVLVVRLLGQEHPYVVRAHEASLDRQDVNVGRG